MKLGTALLVALLFSILIGAAQAESDAVVTSVRLQVLGSPGCITRADLASRVQARSPRIRSVDDSALSAQVSVDIPRPGTVVAELVLASADGKRSPRRIVVRSCAEAADAVALIITVTLDPTLAKKPATGLVREKSTARDNEVTASPAPETDTVRSSPSAPQSAPVPQPIAKPPELLLKDPAPPVTIESDAPSSHDPPVTVARRYSISVAAQSFFGPAPTVLPGFALYGLAALDRDSLWSPAVQLGYTHVWRSDLSEPGGKASFTLDAASLDVCALRLRWSFIEARACGAAIVGQMTARGAADTDTPGSSTRPFAVAGGAVLVTAGLGAMVELSARLGLGAALIRDAYDFGAPAFHRTGAVTTAMSVGLGARWP